MRDVVRDSYIISYLAESTCIMRTSGLRLTLVSGEQGFLCGTLTAIES